jgi:hypothetical protein
VGNLATNKEARVATRSLRFCRASPACVPRVVEIGGACTTGAGQFCENMLLEVLIPRVDVAALRSLCVTSGKAASI